ncbi:Fic family protein [Xanthobacter autotrophicus]|uniref:Fic family protein n=1 Tax=Xanthobacter TaxID=279 RepID=UPI0024AB4333|nr:Fic family protein [Xanthobacter autotrophicus]MDI4666742.1 Fic family protein [Xanthobacter autotrophicus]
MSDAFRENSDALIGHAWLRTHFGLRVPPPFTESYAVAGARRREVSGRRIIEFYPRSYATGDDPVANLRFALRYEPADLRILVGALAAMPPETIENWVRAEPTGAYARRAWFFYEHFLGRQLDLPDVTTGNYVFALDEKKHITGERRNSQRHRVADNLLGTPACCPTVRRTQRLLERMALHVDAEARTLVESYDPALLARAVTYLYTKETRSSFAIEGENPSPQRAERFIAALRRAAGFDTGSKAAIVDLQNAIVDPRYAARDWRDFQNFVGSTTVDFREDVHFICPRPQDVPALMEGWMDLARRLMAGGVDPVVAAAVTAFAFVFIHPFEDGNGRIHRFMIHHVLSRTGFSPGGVIFPVSAAIIRDQRGYDEVLESFSQPLLALTDWAWTAEREIVVHNDTAPFFRFFDATSVVEYLYDRVVDTVQIDLKEELGFLEVFDRAFESVRDIVDMPDRRASLLIRLMLQNGGRLSLAKRAQFTELTDEEIAAMEIAVQKAKAGVPED